MSPDRFRDRVMFPIHDRSGRVIAFGGQTPSMPTAKPKYLRFAQTEHFPWGSSCYSTIIAPARPPMTAAEALMSIVLINVIAMSQAGYSQYGRAAQLNALTSEQCELLWRMASEPILCFDGDKAGRKAAFRAIDTALPLIGPGKSLRFALLPEGQDPDDLARSEGEAAIAQVVEAATPLAEMLFLREVEGQRFDTPERRAALERRLRELTGTISDERRFAGIIKRIWPSAAGRNSSGPSAPA